MGDFPCCDNSFSYMKFIPKNVNNYSIDELLSFVVNCEVSLQEIIELGLSSDKYSELLYRIKEYEDWTSVKDSDEWALIRFMDKYPNSIYFDEALERYNSIDDSENYDVYSGAKCMAHPSVNPIDITSKYSYIPQKIKKKKTLSWKTIKQMFKKSPEVCNSTVFAPAEIGEGEDMMVQVYVYKNEETYQVVKDSQISDNEATQRSYIPLNFPINAGDKITIKLDMHGLLIDGVNIKEIIWQNKFSKSSFFVHIPLKYNRTKVMGDVYISVNGLELGQMSFYSEINRIRDLTISTEVDCKLYRKVFISYSHKDNDTVKAIAEAYRALGLVEYFYDRHSLAPGELFEKKIFEFIDSSDLFILCWSKNAEKSEWVKKERQRAFYAAIDSPPRLRLYPINISPYAPPPPDMTSKFHFEDFDKNIDSHNEMN